MRPKPTRSALAGSGTATTSALTEKFAPELIMNGFLLALATGVAAGFLPAIRSARAGIVDSLVS